MVPSLEQLNIPSFATAASHDIQSAPTNPRYQSVAPLLEFCPENFPPNVRMSSDVSNTATTPEGEQFPFYRASAATCGVNAYKDTTACSCIIYTDSFDDYFTICQTSSRSTAYFWTNRGTCEPIDTDAQWVSLFDQDDKVGSNTGRQYCSGVFQSDGKVLETTLSMPIGPDAAGSSLVTESDPSEENASLSVPPADFSTISFTGSCVCQQISCGNGACGSPIDRSNGGIDKCTAGTGRVFASDGSHYPCFFSNSAGPATLSCSCKAAQDRTSESSSSKLITTSMLSSSSSTSMSVSQVTVKTSAPSGSAAVATSLPQSSGSSLKKVEIGCLLLIIVAQFRLRLYGR